MLYGLICPYCGEETNIEGSWKLCNKTVSCNLCGEKCYMYSDEGYDGSYWFMLEKDED
jgi:transcription elongation factor Elf1